MCSLQRRGEAEPGPRWGCSARLEVGGKAPACCGGIDLPTSSSLPQSGCGEGLQTVIKSSFHKESRHETLGGEGPSQRLETSLLEMREYSVSRGDAGSRCLVTRHQRSALCPLSGFTTKEPPWQTKPLLVEELLQFQAQTAACLTQSVFSGIQRPRSCAGFLFSSSVVWPSLRPGTSPYFL